MSPRRVLSGSVVAVAAAVGALAAAPAALAATDGTWTGASTTSTNWSDGLNWVGGVAPSGAIGNLTFGDLATCDAGTAPAGSACYTSIDNLGPATVNELTIGGGKMYQLYPTSNDNPADTITLAGNGGSPNIGLSAAPTTTNLQLADFGIPVTLGAAQQWNLSNYGILYMNSIGGNYPLTLNLNNGYLQANDVETSSVTMSGPGELQLDQFTGSPEKLPAITINDSAGTQTALAVATQNATENGSLTISGTSNNFIVLTDHAPGETTLQVNGNVTLDSSTNVEFDLDGNNTTPGTDASQLTSSGTVNLNGAAISLWQAESGGSCATLTPGTTFTVISAGALNGNITVGGQTVAPGGSATETLSTNMCSSVTTKAIVTYATNKITATIAGPPAAAGQAPQISGGTHAGDKLTVSDNGSWTGGPTPTYSYQWYSCAGSSCAPIGGATGSSYTLTNGEAGRTVKLQVTASNSYGKASAFSNALGPVTGTPTVAVAPRLAARIRADLNHLGHPVGRRALLFLLRHGFYRTRFVAPVAGTLTDVWRATVQVGRGKHARHRTFVVARGIARPHGARRIILTVRLTGVGRRLLSEHRFNLPTIATQRFRPARGGWITVKRRFRL